MTNRKKKKKNKVRKANSPASVTIKKPKGTQSQNQNNVQIASQKIEAISFQGPLPHPNDLAAYNQIFPGAAEIIINMAVSQSEHRQELEKAVVKSDIKNSGRGLLFALIISVGAISGTIYCASIGQPWVAGALGSGAFASIVTAFIHGTNSRKKEREQKRKNMELDSPSRSE